ncbi:MAG: hypothetical protein NUV88_02645 [Candidatus Kaiserbacteria bacterium]|nr:hypothetical protein [Candidatus Kaiserbacteria bacterium]
MIEIIPTNTCPPNLAELSKRSEAFAKFAPWVQLDIDDGVFAPEISWPYQNEQWAEVESMATASSALPLAGALKYEVHLMVEDPFHIGELMARVGCTRILAHVETLENEQSAKDAFLAWKSAGAKEVGLAILIDTPLSALDALIPLCDSVQIMSIAKLGYQGAQFDSRAIDRIKELHAKYPNLMISVDGGVSESNIAELVRAGAQRFGVGSAISRSADPASAYLALKARAESA